VNVPTVKVPPQVVFVMLTVYVVESATPATFEAKTGGVKDTGVGDTRVYEPPVIGGDEFDGVSNGGENATVWPPPNKSCRGDEAETATAVAPGAGTSNGGGLTLEQPTIGVTMFVVLIGPPAQPATTARATPYAKKIGRVCIRPQYDDRVKEL
jgi:hypothetical protein